MNKKAVAPLVMILVLIILGFVILNFATRDCSKNTDCTDDSYCGSDYECHKYPDKVLVKKNNLVTPALILGISLIIAAHIYRRKKTKE